MKSIKAEIIIEKLIRDLDASPKNYITVAEFKTIEVDGLTKTIDTNTAIISPSLVPKIKASHVNPYVKTTGVNYNKEFIYSPSYWLYLSKTNGLSKVEPLVVSWESTNNTTLIIDQGFVSTFKLIPRLLNDSIYWDDLSRPKYEVVKNKLISQYDFPKQTWAYVQIQKNYLEDYFYLRKKAAIQVYTVIQNVYPDTDILNILEDEDYYIEEFKQYEIRIQKINHKDNIVRIEINGYKLLYDSSIPEKTDTVNGHYWKGIDGLVTHWRARHEMPFEYVYVSDQVLEKYENDDDYEIYPSSGSVKYKGQWGISHCERIGKNGIKLEIKKLYEGVPKEIIDYWNNFSIERTDIDKGENIVLKAERLTKKYFLFSRLLSNGINKICKLNLTPSDIITLDEERIEYTGWMEFPDYKPITNHVNTYTFSKEQFLLRCKKLYILIGENLQQRSLRMIVNNLGFPLEETEELKGLKLLELILKYIYVVEETSLTPLVQNKSILERVAELKEFNFLSRLFALYSLRHLDAHKNSSTKNRLEISLKAFGIEPNSITNNYASVCEQVYDYLSDMFEEINDLLLAFAAEKDGV
jgi:hypothetical protein